MCDGLYMYSIMYVCVCKQDPEVWQGSGGGGGRGLFTLCRGSEYWAG